MFNGFETFFFVMIIKEIVTLFPDYGCKDVLRNVGYLLRIDVASRVNIFNHILLLSIYVTVFDVSMISPLCCSVTSYVRVWELLTCHRNLANRCDCICGRNYLICMSSCEQAFWRLQVYEIDPDCKCRLKTFMEHLYSQILYSQNIRT
jgi:hypothetical protein